jgi:hypothetical protein
LQIRERPFFLFASFDQASTMSAVPESDLAKKLNLKPGMKALVVGKPADVDLAGVTTSDSAGAEDVIVFVRNRAEVDALAEPMIDAARSDRVAWAVYPKAGQLGTDLNRDILWEHLQKKGVQGVRQIAIDGVWSAMRFRPAK